MTSDQYITEIVKILTELSEISIKALTKISEADRLGFSTDPYPVIARKALSESTPLVTKYYKMYEELELMHKQGGTYGSKKTS